MTTTRTLSLPAFDNFDPTSHPGHELKSFNTWLRRFDNRYKLVTTIAATASEQEKEADKKSWLLNYVVDGVLDQFESLYTTTALWEASTYTDLITKYKAQLKPNQTTTLMRHRFYKLYQEEGETFDTFVSKVKKEVVYCEFSCQTDADTLTRDQIVKGVLIERIREGALKNDWSLNDLITNGRRIEAAKASVTELKDDSSHVDNPVFTPKTEPINRVDASQKGNRDSTSSVKSSSRPCFFCASYCSGGNQCPAQGASCTYCHKSNHLEKACMRKKKGIPRVASQARRSKNVRVVATGEDSDSADDARHEQGKPLLSPRKALPIFALSGNEEKASTQTVRVSLNSKDTLVLPDSGSGGSVLPDCCVPENVTLRPTKTVLIPYKSQPIHPLGKIWLSTQWGDRCYKTKWYVVESGALGNDTPLLSRKASEALGILVINTSPQNSSPQNSTPIPDISACQQQPIAALRASEGNNAPPHKKGDPNGPLNVPENLEALKSQYKHLFGRDGSIGKLNNRKLHLYAKEGVKPRIAPYRPIPFHLVEKVEKELQWMLEQDIIEEYSGPVEWLSNLNIVPKPNPDEIRVTVDLRAVNNALQNTHKPIPSVETIKTKFNGKTVFSKLDFKSAFNQIEVDEESRKFLVFRAGNRLFCYKRMTMGLLPASGEFMDMVAPQFNHIDQACMIHDDSTVAGTGQADHDNGLRSFLKTADELGLTLNEEKCKISQPEIPFWGMIVSKDGLKPDPLKVETLKQISSPKTKEELVSFLAMVRANDNFIPNIPKHTPLLRELTKKGTRFNWSEAHEKEFQDLKHSFNKHFLLAHYDPTSPTFVFVDGSKHGLGAILCQGPSVDKCSPITVASRATHGAEPGYPQIDIEGMAIDFALKRFRFYLVGCPNVTIVTDHKPLVPMFSNTRPGSTRIEKIKMQHQDIDFNVIYQKGKGNMSDYFSRHPVPFANLEESVQEESREHAKLLFNLTVCPFTQAIPNEDVVRETEKDEVLTKLKLAILLGHCPPEDLDLKPYRKVFPELAIVNDIIYRGHKLVLPVALRELAVDLAHQAGHQGIARLKSLLRMYYWFPGLDTLAEEWVRSCDCQLFTKDRLTSPITSAPTPTLPWQKVSVDMFGPMPDDEHVLMIRDNFSRFPAAEVVRSTAAKDVIPAMDKIYSDFGTPESHKTDSGPPFNSESFSKFSKNNNITHIRIPPLHPRSNEAECMMKPLGKAMKVAHHNRLDKKQELRKFIKEYRATPHPSTGVAPGDVIFRSGYNTGRPSAPPPSNILEVVKLADARSKLKNRNYVNNKRFTRRRQLIQGDWVLLKHDRRTRKFEPYYEREPYIITDIKGDLVSLKRLSDGRSVLRHTSAVKPFHARKPQKQTVVKEKTFYDEDVEEIDILSDTPMLTDGEEPECALHNQGTVQRPGTPPAAPPPPPGLRRSTRERTSTFATINRDFAPR